MLTAEQYNSMYKYQIEVLVQSSEDYATVQKSITLHLDYEPNEEALYAETEDYFDSRGQLLLEILDYNLVDIE